MERYMMPRRLYCSVLALLLAFSITAPQVVTAQDALQQFEQFIRAGEFAPARDLANKQQDPQLRNQMLQQLAGAQARSGNKRASFHSLSGLSGGSGFQSGSTASLPGLSDGILGGQGGAAMADFQSLIDLITTTIAPDSWEDNGGSGVIKEFRSGVHVDTNGLLSRIDFSNAQGLTQFRQQHMVGTFSADGQDIRKDTAIRKVSLNRLERALQMQRAQGKVPDASMLNLAGIYRIEYVLVYPETGDVVIAGPAGPWQQDAEGRNVNIGTSQPTLQLDDLVSVLRNAYSKTPSHFGCSIDPTKTNLQRVQQYLAASKAKPLKPGEDAQWLEGLRSSLGRQVISVDGIDARSHVARVIVEADYHMKLIGMGIEPGTPNVISYLDQVAGNGGKQQSMGVLRWWFAANYRAVEATPTGDAFRIKGPGVKLMSENEFLDAQGNRKQTGQARGPAAVFAHMFTQNYNDLATKYPIYSDLRNVFDLSLAAMIIRSKGMPSKVGWDMQYLLHPQGYQLTLANAPKEVESVVGHRSLKNGMLIAGVSGGVEMDLQPLLASKWEATDDYDAISAVRVNSERAPRELETWWWD